MKDKYKLLDFNKEDYRLLVNIFLINLRDRFLGSKLGLIWSIANPIMMLSIFTFVFGFVFKSKLPGAETSLSYVIWLISGYGPWLAISEGMSSSTMSVVVNGSLIKNVVFKSEILPFAGALIGIVPLVISMIFLVILLVIDGKTPGVSWMIIPFVVLLQFFLVAGIGLFLSSINVFIRDTALVLPNILLLFLFGSPILFPIEVFPEVFRLISQFNPLYIIAEGYRQPLFHNEIPELWSITYLVVLVLLICISGLLFFGRLKNYFNSRL